MNERDHDANAYKQAVSFGLLHDEDVAPWTMLESGRYQPRRFKGSYHGRELG